MHQNPPLQYRERRLVKIEMSYTSRTALVSKLLSLTCRVSFCQHYKYVVRKRKSGLLYQRELVLVVVWK